MVDLSGKKLLILGGAFQHSKLVEAAKNLGVVTYVTDYLPIEDAPAKRICDKYYMYDILEYDEIVKMCRNEGIDGVISTSLDACQKPYFHICEKLGVPCFGNEEQFKILTNKSIFKKKCLELGLDTIPEYNLEDFKNEEICKKKVEFPILVKPSISRGSRGQTICYDFDEVHKAVDFAKGESSNGDIVIEKYMGQANDFSMTVIIVNKKAYVIRTVDRILGKYEDGLDKLAVGSVSPSVFTELYLDEVHNKIQKFVDSIGLVNAPLFMQGFVDGNKIRFYDPGLRLPGGEYERMFKHVFKKDPLECLVEFSLTGQVSVEENFFSNNDVKLDGKIAGQVLPTLKPGKISEITGLEEIRNHKQIVSVFERYKIGDVIQATKNVNQRFCEIDIVSENIDQLSEVVSWIFETLKITDENGENMIVSRYDSGFVSKYKINGGK